MEPEEVAGVAATGTDDRIPRGEAWLFFCSACLLSGIPIMMMFLVPDRWQCYLFLLAPCYADKSHGGGAIFTGVSWVKP
ncbi:MAG: hypothetical protein ABS69_17250 [Nitrosomonadales bacterium SCN 54-20]|nr:MAG: hypothetical protein ABS69_17250 [Nitrosomonadales bacterium SCN 54-20]